MYRCRFKDKRSSRIVLNLNSETIIRSNTLHTHIADIGNLNKTKRINFLKNEIKSDFFINITNLYIKSTIDLPITIDERVKSPTKKTTYNI